MTTAQRIAGQPLILRRALALLVAAGFAVLVWNAVVLPIAWITASQDHWRSDARVELARGRGRAAAEADLRAKLSTLPTAQVWNRFYYVAEGADGRTLIQRDVTGLCATAGAIVQSVVPLPGTEQSELVRHGVRVTTSLTVDQLKSLVGAIRNHPQYLRVEHLKVSAPQIQPVDQNPALLVTLEVFGYSYTEPRRDKA